MRRYLFAICCVLAAFLIRFWLNPVLGEELPLMLFIAASLVAAWYGGAIAGVVALLLGLMLASEFFFPVQREQATKYPSEVLHLVRYFFIASFGIVLIEVLRRDHERIRMAANKLREEMERRKRSEEALLQAQAQLRQHADALEGHVRDRTARLSATNEALRDLLYHIAHNLRAPLRAVEGYSTLLAAEYAAMGDERATVQDYLRRISQAAVRMDQLISDLLQYGRLGHSEVKISDVDLGECLRAVVVRMAREIEVRQGTVEAREPLPVVSADRQLLENCLTHLLENAL